MIVDGVAEDHALATRAALAIRRRTLSQPLVAYRVIPPGVSAKIV